MSHHTYNHKEYYSSEFAEFIRRGESKYGSYPVKQSGGSVESRIEDISWKVNFEDGDNPKYLFEVSRGNAHIEIKAVMHVQRSSEGRISGNHWHDFLENVVIEEVRKMARA